LEYHAKNAIVQMISFRDMLLHLTNEILELGIKGGVINIGKHGSPSKMRKKLISVDASGKLLQLFDNYDEQLKKLKEFRNLHIHEGKFYDSTLSEIDQVFYLIAMADRYGQEIEPRMMLHHHNPKWKLKNRKKELIELTQIQRDGMEQSFINLTKMLSGKFWRNVKVKSDE